MSMQRLVATLLLMNVSCWAMAQTTAIPSVRPTVSTQDGFSITPPAGWSSVPSSLMNEQMLAQAAPEAQNLLRKR